MMDSSEIILNPGGQRTPGLRRRPDDTVGPPPAIVAAAGGGAEFAWDEFFKGRLANAHTRKNYALAVRHFLDWCDHPDRRPPLDRIAHGHVGDYLAGLELATPTKKLRLAALRKFFDLFVVRHAVVLNPAASVRAVIAVLIYTAARVGAVAKLPMKGLKHDGTQYALRFSEKGGKSREIPVRHDVEQILRGYIEAAGITEGPLFRTAFRRTGKLTDKAMSGIDICRMMNRRLLAAGLPGEYSPHPFRVATVTDLLEQNVPLEDVQHLAGHSDPRTTRLYDRRRRKVTRNIVERISI